MKISASLFIIALFVLASCGNDAQVPKADSDSQHYECILPAPDSFAPPMAVTADTIKECFRYEKGEQHDWIEITRVEDSAWGNLNYTWDEKDGATGNFTGTFHGDTLWIVHKAEMEGHTYPREVAFLIKGEKLYEAQGTQDENNKGVTVYKFRKMLKYTDPHPMIKGPCM